MISPHCACVTVSANALRNDAKQEEWLGRKIWRKDGSFEAPSAAAVAYIFANGSKVKSKLVQTSFVCSPTSNLTLLFNVHSAL